MAELTPGDDRTKPFAPVRVQMQIVGVGTLILLLGLLLAPRTTTPPRPRESPSPILTDQDRLLAATTLAQRVAAMVVPYTVTLAPAAPPPQAGLIADWRLLAVPRQAVLGGLVVSPEGDVVTSAAGLTRTGNLQVRLSTGRTVSGRVRVLDPVTGLAILRMAGLGPFASAAIESMPPAPGEVLVGAVATEEGPVVVSAPVVASRGERVMVSGLPSDLALGLPLFDSGGRAVAVVDTADGDVVSAMLLAAFIGHAERLIQQGRAIPSASGLSWQEISERLAPTFGDAGALVSDVVPRSPAARAGIRPGDVLLRVGDTLVNGPEDAVQVLSRQTPGRELLLTVRSGDGEVVRSLTPDRLLEAQWLAFRRDAPEEGVPARELAGADRLAAAGVMPDARILRVGNAPPPARPGRPVEGLVYVEQRGRRFFTVLPEAPRE